MNPSIQFKTTTMPFLIAFALACFGPLPSTQALAPPPDGGYPGANTAEGTGALSSLSPQGRGSGANNTALGYHTLFSDTTGSFNTATGSVALANNNGDNNTATGYQALVHNTTGSDNTASGYQALYNNTTGNGNTAFGASALFSTTGGIFGSGDNTAIGGVALYNNTTGIFNTATGSGALYFNKTGSNNTATGDSALFLNTTGSYNISLGYLAGYALTIGDYNICIGNHGVDTDSQTIRIGDSNFQTATYIAGISGQAASGGVAVYVNSDGKLGTSNSSIRFKDAIKPMDKASEAILALKPVTFHYKKELDPKSIPQFGLVAEEVEKVNPDLIARDRDGRPYTVRYEAVNAMLLNEFLKEHRTVQELKSAMARQEATIAKQQEGIKALRTQLKEQTWAASSRE